MPGIEITIRVLGSGTSVGVPVINCTCSVCTSLDPRNNRLRSSVAVEAQGKFLLIDCSTDFRAQMLRDPLPRIDALLLTHSHSDHVSGMDDLRIFNYRQDESIPVFGEKPFLDDIRTRLYYAFTPRQKGGGVPHLDMCEVAPGEAFEAAGIEVLPIRVMHGALPILGYRIGDFAYLTDCSGIPPESEALLGGLDTLVLSALRRRTHPTHFSLSEALAAAERLGPRRAWFTHIADDLDHEETNRELPSWAQLLFDGQRLAIGGEEAQA